MFNIAHKKMLIFYFKNHSTLVETLLNSLLIVNHKNLKFFFFDFSDIYCDYCQNTSTMRTVCATIGKCFSKTCDNCGLFSFLFVNDKE